MTDLEKILSGIVHFPVKLTDIKIPKITASTYSAPVYQFMLEVIPSPDDPVKDEFVADDDIPFCDMDCKYCDVCRSECNDCEFDNPCFWGIPDIRRIIFSPPATIVFWDDGTKTVVKCMEDQPFERYAGFAMACMKKMFGSTSRAKAILKACDDINIKSQEGHHAASAE